MLPKKPHQAPGGAHQRVQNPGKSDAWCAVMQRQDQTRKLYLHAVGAVAPFSRGSQNALQRLKPQNALVRYFHLFENKHNQETERLSHLSKSRPCGKRNRLCNSNSSCLKHKPRCLKTAVAGVLFWVFYFSQPFPRRTIKSIDKPDADPSNILASCHKCRRNQPPPQFVFLSAFSSIPAGRRSLHWGISVPNFEFAG